MKNDTEVEKVDIPRVTKKDESLWDQMVRKAKSLNGDELIEMLDKIHPSDAYLLLRDHIDVHQIKILNLNDRLKTRLAGIRKKAKETWDHDHKTATMMDVDKACTQVYKMCLTLVKGINDGQTNVKDAINNLEDRLGIPQTDWVNVPNKTVPAQSDNSGSSEKADTPDKAVPTQLDDSESDEKVDGTGTAKES